MPFLSETLAGLSLEAPVRFENLSVYPLISGKLAGLDYLILDDALAAGLAEISEVSHSGHVPELKFVNKGDTAILLVDGEELVGAKQNRVLNLSILAPAGETIVIPVSCVEAGRWSHRTKCLSSSNRVHFAKGRAEKVSQVNLNMRRGGTARSQQDKIWRDISIKEGKMAIRSETAAMSDIFESNREKLDLFVSSVPALLGQVGAVFALGKNLVGVELFDSPRVFAKMFGKLLRSYALDAIEDDADKRDPPSVDVVIGWLTGLEDVEMHRSKAVGLGDNIRMDGQGYTGAVLMTDRIVHMCAFVQQTKIRDNA